MKGLRSAARAAVAAASFALLGAGAAPSPSPPGPARPIVAGSEIDYPPYCLVTPEGKADGFSVELLRAAAAAVGREVTYRTGIWSDLKRDLAEGRLEALPLVGRTPEREALYDFTFPYLVMHGTIFVRRTEGAIRGAEDLRGREVAVLKGDNAEEYLRRSGLGARIVALPSFEQALRELSEGRHDAVVVQKLVGLEIIRKARIRNLKAVGPPLEDFVQRFCFAVRKGDHALLDRLNEGLSLVFADGAFRSLQAKWFGPLEASALAGRRVVVGGDGDYPPYEFLDANGQPAGLNVDLTRAIAAHAGLEVDIRLGPWGEIRKGLEKGEIDLVQGMFYSAERDATYDFSPPYAVVAHAIAVRKESPLPSDLSSLSGKKVLVMAGDLMEDLARSLGLGPGLVAVPSQEEALRRLSAGEADAALVARVPALFWIRQHGWRNLRLGEAPVLSAEYGYAALPRNGGLLSVFAEGLTAIEKTGEYRAIRTRWLGPYEERGALRAAAKYVVAIVAPLLTLLAGAALWSRSLRRQVVARTRELAAEAEKVRALAAELEGRVQERTAALETAVREMEAFSYSVAHDLRAPIRAIDGFSAMLEEDHAAGMGPEAAHLVARVRAGANRMGRLIDDLLAFSRATRAALARGPINMTGLARRAVAGQAREAAEGGVEVRAGELPSASGDDALVGVVFDNLLSNAIKFSAGRPGALVEIGAEERDGVVEYFVRDNGIGFDPRYASKLFEVFERLHRSDEFAGTGIGLALVRRIVEKHGGRVRAEGEPGRGATFSFTLG